MEEDGVWRTVGGRRIFIKDGEDLETAMKNSGKFSTKKEVEKVGHVSLDEWAKALGRDINSTEESYDEEYKTEGEFQLAQFEEEIQIIKDFTDFGYSDTRQEYQETGEDYITENFIDKYPKLHWSSGDLYRGVSLSDEDLRNLKVGTVINQNGPSSWTSDKDIATEFGNSKSKQREGNSVVFVEKSTRTKNAISVANISSHPEEAEVIYSAFQNFKVDNIYTDNNIKYIEIKEAS